MKKYSCNHKYCFFTNEQRNLMYFILGDFSSKAVCVCFYIKEKRKGSGRIMYSLPICLLIVGIILLVLNSLLFFSDYKATLTKSIKKSQLYVNGIVLLSSVGVIVLSIVYIFMINSQLG